MMGNQNGAAQNVLKLQPNFVDSLKKHKDFKYANDPAYWPKPVQIEENPQGNPFLNWLADGGGRMIFYLLLTVVIIMLMYQLLSTKNLLPFRGSSKPIRRSRVADEIMDEPDPELLLSAAEGKGDFREAVRLQYLSLLYHLRDRNLIEYHPEWTNKNYLAMFRKQAQYPAFRQLTRIYEYVWYGGFNIDREKYELIRGEFSKFRKNL